MSPARWSRYFKHQKNNTTEGYSYVKKYHLTNGIVAALLLASPIAGAETKYPAADFQPEVIYQDAEYIGKKGAPASKAKSTRAKSSQADSKYPAANFEPEVLFQDSEQIKKVEQTAKAVASARSTAAPASSGQAAGAGAAEGGGLMESYWVGLIAFALAGFAVLYSRRPKPEVSEAPAYTIDTSGLTGVARYMRMKAMSGPTGVQKYIEKHGRQFTGVEKYLRRRG
jgi:hypothetical protein